MPNPEIRTPQPLSVAGRGDAEALVAGVLATMGELDALIARETGHLRVGRLREGLAQDLRKTELASAYLQGLEAVKANAVSVARFAPDAVRGLRESHAAFGRRVEENRVVLATARAVSEALVKGLAEEMSRHARPQAYAPAGHGARQPGPSAPLVVSRSF